MFIEPDEHLIVMEDDVVHPYNLADLLALQDSGIRTILAPHRLTQHALQVPVYAGRFRVLIPFYYSGETFVEIVRQKSVIEAKARLNTRISPNLQFIFGLPDGGEFPWDAMQTRDFPLSDDEIINFVIDIQHILYQQYGEIWLAYHNFMGDPLNWNNTRLPRLYAALRDEFPKAPIYSLQYIHFSCGGTPTEAWMQEKISLYSRAYGIRFFVGPDYCEGLDSPNFTAALGQGAWGFVCAPTHAENPAKHEHIQPWMVETLQNADKKLKEHFQNV